MPTTTLTRAQSALQHQVATAIRACEEKKGENIAILEMNAGAFTDYLVLCSGTNQRQVQAISDEVELRLKHQEGVYPNSMEGYDRAEWVLLDYVDFVVQVFVESARKFYDLDRLWKSAKRLSIHDLEGKPSRARRTPMPAAAASASRKRVKRKSTAEIGRSVRAASGRRSTAKAKAKAKPAKKRATAKARSGRARKKK